MTAPDLTQVTSWYQVAGLFIIVMATMVVPQVMSILTAKRAERSSARVEKTLTTNNGGSHVKDKLDKLLVGQEVQREFNEDQRKHNERQEGMLKEHAEWLGELDDRMSEMEDMRVFGERRRPRRFTGRRYTRTDRARDTRERWDR